MSETSDFLICRARAMGMCTGLRRILDRTEHELAKGQVSIFGDFVHNDHVYRSLASFGATRIDSVDAIEVGSSVVIGPHGNTSEIVQEISARAELIDVSCPKVNIVIERAIEFDSLGYRVVFVGRRGHEEFRSIQSHVIDVMLVESPVDVDHLDPNVPLAFVAQSTLQSELFKSVVSRAVATRDSTSVVQADTICSETRSRQTAAKELAKAVDLMIIIGDPRSYNTQALAHTCAKFTSTHSVDNASELDRSLLSTASKVGVTAGASTPDAIVDEVVELLIALGGKLEAR